MQIKTTRWACDYKKLLLLALFLIAVGVVLVAYFSDPYRHYKSLLPQSIELNSVQLRHHQPNLLQINTAFKSIKPQQKQIDKLDEILAGLHWLVVFIDDDERFVDLFSDFVIFSHELSRNKNYPVLSEIGEHLLTRCLQRAQYDLDKIFSSDPAGLWDFIGILPIVAEVPELREVYFQFYRSRFAKLPKQAYQSEGLAFNEAVASNNYQVIGDYLIDTSFLHYYLLKSDKPPIILPPDDFRVHMKAFEVFEYPMALDSHSDAFSELAYLATHVVLVMTNYGELNLKADVNSDKVSHFLDASYAEVRFELNDLDLLAEYLQSLKILNSRQDSRIIETESFILSLQRSNGSWGTQADFAGDPYEAFHPTWAVLTALIH